MDGKPKTTHESRPATVESVIGSEDRPSGQVNSENECETGTEEYGEETAAHVLEHGPRVTASQSRASSGTGTGSGTGSNGATVSDNNTGLHATAPAMTTQRRVQHTGEIEDASSPISAPKSQQRQPLGQKPRLSVYTDENYDYLPGRPYIPRTFSVHTETASPSSISDKQKQGTHCHHHHHYHQQPSSSKAESRDMAELDAWLHCQVPIPGARDWDRMTWETDPNVDTMEGAGVIPPYNFDLFSEVGGPEWRTPAKKWEKASEISEEDFLFAKDPYNAECIKELFDGGPAVFYHSDGIDDRNAYRSDNGSSYGYKQASDSHRTTTSVDAMHDRIIPEYNFDAFSDVTNHWEAPRYQPKAAGGHKPTKWDKEAASALVVRGSGPPEPVDLVQSRLERLPLSDGFEVEECNDESDGNGGEDSDGSAEDRSTAKASPDKTTKRAKSPRIPRTPKSTASYQHVVECEVLSEPEDGDCAAQWKSTPTHASRRQYSL